MKANTLSKLLNDFIDNRSSDLRRLPDSYVFSIEYMSYKNAALDVERLKQRLQNALDELEDERDRLAGAVLVHYTPAELEALFNAVNTDI